MKKLIEREVKKIERIFKDNDYDDVDKLNFLKCKLELAYIYQNNIEIEACKFIMHSLI